MNNFNYSDLDPATMHICRLFLEHLYKWKSCHCRYAVFVIQREAAAAALYSEEGSTYENP